MLTRCSRRGLLSFSAQSYINAFSSIYVIYLHSVSSRPLPSPLYAHCAPAIGHLTILNLKHTHFNTKLLAANYYNLKCVYRGIWNDTDMQLVEGERLGVKSLGKMENKVETELKKLPRSSISMAQNRSNSTLLVMSVLTKQTDCSTNS